MEMGVLEKVAKVFERALELLDEFWDNVDVELEEKENERGGTIRGDLVRVTWRQFETANDYVFSVSVSVKGQVAAVARRVVHYYCGYVYNDRFELWYNNGKEEEEGEVYIVYEGEDLLDDDEEYNMVRKIDNLMWKLTM